MNTYDQDLKKTLLSLINDMEGNELEHFVLNPEGEVFDITKDIVITRHSTDPYAVNKEKYKYMTKQARFDFIPSSKYPNYEMSIRFLFFLRAVCSMPP